MLDAEAFEITQQIITILEKLDITYVIGGSVASAVHGIVRTTLDVDIVTDIRPEHVSSFVDALKDQFYLDEPTVRQAVSGRGAFNLIHYDTMVKVDIFVRKDREFDQQQLERRVDKIVSPEENIRLWVVSAEDIILAKLDWYRMGGEVSERQWRDVLGVLKTQAGNLDLVYLAKWAGSLGVADLLTRALDEI